MRMMVLTVGAGGAKLATNQELMTRVRVAYENRLRELRDELEQIASDSRCQRNANAYSVDKNSSLSQKRLDVLQRKLDQLKRSNLSSVGPLLSVISCYYLV